MRVVTFVAEEIGVFVCDFWFESDGCKELRREIVGISGDLGHGYLRLAAGPREVGGIVASLY